MRRPSSHAAARCVAALLLASGVGGTAVAAGGTDEPVGPPVPTGEPTATTAQAEQPTATTTQTQTQTEVPAPAVPAASDLDTTPDPWKLGDDIAARMDPRWNASRGCT